jgi:hypothetical protein
LTVLVVSTGIGTGVMGAAGTGAVQCRGPLEGAAVRSG